MWELDQLDDDRMFLFSYFRTRLLRTNDEERESIIV